MTAAAPLIRAANGSPPAAETRPGATLEARALDFGYPDHRVGHGVSLSLAAGEVVCLLGPNGGGKSTLFRTLLGLLPAQGGAVLLGGDPIASLPRTTVAQRVSYVPQAHSGYFPFTVRDVVLMGRTAHLPTFGTPSKHDAEIAAAAIERVGLADLADHVYTKISGGERQLALIARALAQQAPLVVMDEPTASLDFGNQARVLDEVRALARSGTGVMMATHDPDQAFLVADRVALLAGGRLVGNAPPADAITPASMREVYGIDVEITDLALASGERRRVCVPINRG